ncbi:MAG: YfhO family protein [Lachnospiraceae bacterium]|nr:YfhO family protein [Lachnospiraceae bacterium]
MNGFNDKKIKLNIKHAIVTSILVLVMFIGVSVICRITPFGDKTFLMFDLKRQYVDYDSYLKTVLSGDNNIFYSFSTTLGSGTTGFFTYYLMSPFLILLSLCPQNLLPLGISIVICIKLMLASFIMDLFLQRIVIEERINSLTEEKSIGLMICSVSWAFSGFLFAHSMNMMWTDVVILLPLLIWALENLLENDRKCPYIVCLTAMLIINYYISFQVLLFTALWTLMRIFVRADKHPVKQVIRVLIPTLIAPCIGAFLLIPTALELANSPKDITQLGLELTGSNLLIRDVFSKLPTLAYDYIEARYGYPQIFCGVLLIMLTMFYFIDRKRTVRERVGMLILFVIMLVSFCRDIINLIWHAGMEPSGHPYRQAFLWVFMMILCSAHALNDMDSDLKLIRLFAVIGLMALLFFEVIRKRYDHVSKYTLYANVALLIIYGILFLVYFLLKNRSSKIPVVLVAVMLFINIADLSINAVYTHTFQFMNGQKLSDYSDTISRTDEAVRYTKTLDSSFYRMENLNPRQQNDAMQYGYNGITHYSSAGMTYVRYFLQKLGYNDDGLYTHYGHDNTAAADSLLGVKYVMSDGMYRVHEGYKQIFDGDEKVYENPWALGVATETDGFDLNGISVDYRSISSDSMEHVPNVGPFELQEDIYSRLLGEKVSIFADASVSQSDIFEEDGKYCVEFVVTPAGDGELYMYLEGLIGRFESLSLYIDGEFLTTYGNAACLKVLNLGYRKSKDKITVRVCAENEDDNFGKARFVTEDIRAIADCYEKLQFRKSKITKISSSHLKINTGDHEGVFLSIPCEKGWKIKVDGKKTEPVAVYDSLTYIPIYENATAHTIDMIFIPEGAFAGALLSLIGIVIFAGLIFYEEKWSREKIIRTVKAVMVVIIIMTLGFITVDDIRQRTADRSSLMYADLGNIRINIFHSGREYYLFLPGYADEKDLKYSKEALKHDINVMKSDNIHTIFISTRSGSLDNIYADKEYKEAGRIKVMDPLGNVSVDTGLKYIKGRGNYSWMNWEKRPFSIKLKDGASISELSSESTYALIANASDETLIRNEIARQMEIRAGVPYAKCGIYTDLYINGDYMGNYYLCDTIDIAPDKIDIRNMESVNDMLRAGNDPLPDDVYETLELKGWNLPETGEDITGGYLIQREFPDRYHLEYGTIGSGFSTANSEHFIVESPEHCSVSEINYISGFVAEAEKAIMDPQGINPDTGIGYEDYIDIGSFADRYLVEETLKNYDGGVSSAYYYKDCDQKDGHLYAGPGWDFDMSLGNYLDWMQEHIGDAGGFTKMALTEGSSVWFKELLKKEEFMKTVRNDYREKIRPYLLELEGGKIEEYREYLGASAAMDRIRWHDMYQENSSGKEDADIYNELTGFISLRREYLDGEWLD